jgi:hypothetical protein
LYLREKKAQHNLINYVMKTPKYSALRAGRNGERMLHAWGQKALKGML